METYEEMRKRIHPERYKVLRLESGVAHMSRGDDRWDEPAVQAVITNRETGRHVATLSLNSATLAIPEGPSGKYPRGVEATDEEIILAVVGDEPIFSRREA